jgi:selenocysteine-specific elongation factor
VILASELAIGTIGGRKAQNEVTFGPCIESATYITDDDSMSTAVSLKHVLIGTAGHIDHGKTRLVSRLTGVDTDRLPEEKARGISIDLGFAHWEAEEGDCRFQFGVIDVPGHERFVRNMVAGATGINLALLVIAADDGVMLQTREHLEIMDLLGVQAGVIAITKIDLVEPDFVELVEAEIEEVTAGTFLEGCPVVPVSSETGEGIDVLRSTLTKLAAGTEWPQPPDLFRMPIDRVFSITGQGSIVTGSVLSGEVNPGDVLELLPEERSIRVRSVENHGMLTDDSSERQRTAINPAGVKTDELSRGQELATPGYLKPTKRFVVELRSLGSSTVILKDRLNVSLHLGTCETFASVILKGKQLKPGERSYAELRTADPVMGVHGQRFILRRPSPPMTIAGGRILDPGLPAGKRLKDLAAYAAAMDSPNAQERLSFLLSHADSVDESPLEAARRAGIDPGKFMTLIEQLKSEGILTAVGDADRPLVIHRDRLQSMSASVLRTIREEVQRHQPRRTLPRNTLLTACRGIARNELLIAVLEYLLKKKELVEIRGQLGPADAQVKLTKNQRRTLVKMLDTLTAAGLTPPTIKVLAADLGQKPEQLQPLLNLSVEDGLLVRVNDELYFAPEAIDTAREMTSGYLKEHGEATMSQLREAWSVSRKFAVPLCELFDQLEITNRQGDVRTSGPKADVPFSTDAGISV